MKARPAVKGALALVTALACVYLGRVGALWLLARLFQNANLNSDTYAYAGKALRFLADNADSIATLTGLFIAIAAGLYLKDLFEGEDGAITARAAAQLLLPLLTGYFTVRLLVSADAVREPLVRTYGTPCAWLLCLALCAARSIVLRGCCVKAAKESAGETAALIVSAVLDGIFFLFVFGGGKNVLACVNGLLTGAVMASVYRMTRSLWPELLICSGFTAGCRFLGGYTDGGLYSVGEGILTGCGRGIECSLVMTGALIVILTLVYLYGKNSHGRKKTLIHR